MALRDSIETNFVGSFLDIQSWEIYDWAYVCIRIAILCGYIILQTLVSGSRRCLGFLVQNHLTNVALKINSNLCSCIPFFGKYLQRLLPRYLTFVSNNLIPRLEKLSQLVQLCFQLHIVEMTLKNKNNVQIFVTAESDDLRFYDENNKLITTLLMANHRSINDYVLINYLVQNSGKFLSNGAKKREVLRRFWRDDQLSFPRLKFITWGKVVNFPHLSLLKNIMTKDENCFLLPKQIKQHLSINGNEVVTIFPEVNILTTELSIIQRKLNQDYSFVAKFYNVLYPRFKGFISVIGCFAHINKVKQRQHYNILKNAKSFLNNGVDKFLVKAAGQTENNAEQDFAQAKMILGLHGSYRPIEGEVDFFDSKKEEHPSAETIKINEDLFDLTIIYYKPKRINTKADHDHVDGQFKLHNGYKLEQVNPSLIEMLQPEKLYKDKKTTYRTTKPPIVIMIHIKKHEIGPLLPAKGRNLEKWLENQWSQKDKLIDCIENGITIR